LAFFDHFVDYNQKSKPKSFNSRILSETLNYCYVWWFR